MNDHIICHTKSMMQLKADNMNYRYKILSKKLKACSGVTQTRLILIFLLIS